ncbi:MAG: S9 family peptidase [Balneolaceae bacterium]|nr:MAG: S9 family peptidase [Balneolaceae bacterium]
MTLSRSLLLFFISFFSFSLSSLLAQQGVLPADYYQTVFVSQTEISPDGSLIAFTRTVIKEEDNSRHSEVWMQKLTPDGEPDGQPFRFTDETANSSGPVWSPDGTLLAIQSRRGDDRNAVRFLRVTAPGGEAFTLEGVDRAPVWSPDGSMIAFVREPHTEEEPHPRAGWIAPDAITHTLDSTRFDGRVITQMRYMRDGTSAWLPHPSVEPKRQIHVIAADGGEPRMLTSLPFNTSQPEWSRDSQFIYFSGDPMEDDEYNTDFTRMIYRVDIESEELATLSEMEGSHASPVVSPDGRYLAFGHTPGRGEETNVFVAELDGNGLFSGEALNLTPSWDLQPGSLHWTPDSQTIRFSAQTRGNDHLFEVAVTGGNVEQITHGERRISSVSVSADGERMAYTSTDAVTPAELFLSGRDGSDEKQLTEFNAAWMAERTIMPAEEIVWTVSDGTEIQGWVIRPVGYEPGSSWPLVMKIHGGPHSAYGNTWFQAFHTLSASGMFVFYPNPRGSTSYGNAFTYATLGQWGVMDEEDFMTGLEAVLEKYPDIDPDRIGVSGGSYGGFMTNWLTARFPDSFRAAVTSRSISNWESWYGSSDAQGLTEFEFDGTPWEQRELYRKLSPISYVEHVTAPTLIIHSEEDWRTPITDGEQWYMALKKRQVPVEFVRYPRSSHGLSRTGEPWLLVDRLERKRSWFDYWLNQAE